jgi:hypothetical protein
MRACLDVDFGGPSAFWKKFRRVLFRFTECGCDFAPAESLDGVEIRLLLDGAGISSEIRRLGI